MDHSENETFKNNLKIENETEITQKIIFDQYFNKNNLRKMFKI